MPALAQASPFDTHPDASLTPTSSRSVNWLEPRALSVLDFVGQVPEEHLRDSVLIFGQAGVTQYLRGERVGDQVTIEVSISTWIVDHNGLIRTEMPCLGRRPIFDEWPVPVPPAEMRVFSRGIDITDQVLKNYAFTPSQQQIPIWGSAGDNGLIRYHFERQATFSHSETGALIVPANMGCHIWLPGSVPDLTAKFVFNYPQQIHIETLGSETFSFHSYIGVGSAGEIDALRRQLVNRYGSRHEKFILRSVPAGTDYVWLNYPPTPVSLYASALTDENIDLPFGGTYRFIGHELSNDHVVSMGLPLYQQWTDSDLVDGSWLPQNGPVNMISSPEYFVPPGVAYDPCMRLGNCKDTVLDEIYNKQARMTLYYYHVRRLSTSNLMKVPLHPVGPDWRPGDEPSVVAESITSRISINAESCTLPPHRILLPSISYSPPPPFFPDDAPEAGCPCGWFDSYFRMLDVIPGLSAEPVQ